MLALVAAAGCAPPADRLLELTDPSGDVRLIHPPAPGVEAGTFDLERLVIERLPDRIQVEATFASPVRPITPLPRDAASGRAWLLPTVDVYLDLGPGGDVTTLPGRKAFVPASQAWDRVLILGGSEASLHPAAVAAIHLVASGRILRGTFPRDAIDGPILGALAVSLATSVRGDGGVRSVGVLKGDCSAWDEDRCTLIGSGPPILDATSAFDGDVLSLTYPKENHTAGAPPVVKNTVVVAFYRDGLATVAPIDPSLAATVKPGALATLMDASGHALATAVVDSVLRDAATLRVVGSLPISAPSHAVFEAGTPKVGTPTLAPGTR